jgi:4-hydroxythreonine-4-phosphate dehydrogenase
VKIAVAGLNPHASENGLFGSEEENEIIPAINEARARGIDAVAPFRRIPCSSRPARANTAWWSPCTTTRAHSREAGGLCHG